MECPHTATIQKLENDMYHGDARKPGMTTRAENLEGRVDAMEETQKTTDNKYTTIIVLLLTVLGGLAVDLIKR